MEWYCTCVSKFIAFRTSHEKGFLVFDVPNVKYLAFGILDGNALTALIFTTILCSQLHITFIWIYHHFFFYNSQLAILDSYENKYEVSCDPSIFFKSSFLKVWKQH